MKNYRKIFWYSLFLALPHGVGANVDTPGIPHYSVICQSQGVTCYEHECPPGQCCPCGTAQPPPPMPQPPRPPMPPKPPRPPMPPPRPPMPCTETTTSGRFSMCDGEWGPWGDGRRSFNGTRCRTVTRTSSCGGSSTREECIPCGYDEVDTSSPWLCGYSVDWDTSPRTAALEICDDDASGCDQDSFSFTVNNGDQFQAEVCDNAGNCGSCLQLSVDTQSPTCEASFVRPEGWHGEASELECELGGCEDLDPDGTDPDIGQMWATTRRLRQYETDSGCVDGIEVLDNLDPQHEDTCRIRVCDRAGNCGTCQSEALEYDGVALCKRGDSACGECAEEDNDCRCIKGEEDKCRDDGPVNCYVTPFHERCPGLQNPLCLGNGFVPGCPVINPCYPDERGECPMDATRFCARNPYHYSCNTACSDEIDCDPEPPVSVE